FAKMQNLAIKTSRTKLNAMLKLQKHPMSRIRAEANSMPEDTNAESSNSSRWGELFDALPLDERKNNLTDYARAWGEKAINVLGDKVSGLNDNTTSGENRSGAMGEAAQQGAQKLAEGDSPLTAGLSGSASGVKEKVKETFGGRSG